MTAQVDTNWQYRGLQVVRLENEALCLDVLPELGAKVWNLVHKPSGRNLLWHNPHLPPARQAYGARFDDTWSGGWDELIPTDIPTRGRYGDILPDHGEVWSQPSEVEVLAAGGDRATVRFTNYGRVLPTRFEKTISLAAAEPFCRVSYRYENLGEGAIEFLWNIHPALAISPATRLDIPARRVIADPWSADRLDAWSEHEWPYAVDGSGRGLDLRSVPPKGDYADFHYLPDVTAGWYAATDTSARIGFGLAFSTSVFPHLWLFRPLGGWRGLYTLIIEASTGYPSDLAVAREHGHCSHLEPGQALAAEVTAVVYTGVTSVKAISMDGTVTAGDGGKSYCGFS